ncbi:MAG: hypothetical protein JSU87_10515 [Gemmatimonadota bacterium]|nr:MAG: hypothetical protein JSU87_10515 [Gemmatimonadota bacterium]
MAERRRRLLSWVLVRLLILTGGFAAGYYVRDRQMDRLEAAYEAARAELEEMKQAGEEVLDRGQRTGEVIRGGAEAAVDSAKAAVEELKGGQRD